MKFNDFLPLGSVVLLKGAIKKIVIVGIMPTKALPNHNLAVYEYIGVPYPEGYVGNNSALFFNHKDIDTIVFRGYESEERTLLLDALQKMLDSTDAVIAEKKKSLANDENQSVDDIF